MVADCCAITGNDNAVVMAAAIKSAWSLICILLRPKLSFVSRHVLWRFTQSSIDEIPGICGIPSARVSLTSEKSCELQAEDRQKMIGESENACRWQFRCQFRVDDIGLSPKGS
jgi:hypothetical protein